MNHGTQACAERRGLLSAALLGSGMGLILGVSYLAAGMADHIGQRAEAERMADAAAIGYAGSHLEAQGRGLRVGLEQYGFRSGTDAQTVAIRFGNDRGAAKAMRRADLECMTDAVYYEARGESARGQAAVAQVVMNRVSHPSYPKSVCGVVFQGAGRSGCQFSFACDGSMKRTRETGAWDRARAVARRTLAGASGADIGRATHFHTTAVSPFWAPSMQRVAQVGTHIFYKLSPYRAQLASRSATRNESVVLISGQAEQVLGRSPLVEQAIEASLQPAPDLLPQPTTGGPVAPKANDATALAVPQTVSVATS